MQVEAIFPDLPRGPVRLLMSRTSPGRYAMHEFAKNVYDVQIDDGAGGALSYAQPNPSEWEVTDHRGSVRVRYKVFGDQIDGTFLGIDSTHAHINMPAAIVWARGLEGRAVRVMFAGDARWKVATQLAPSSDPSTFTAPNLHYLIDSPVEFSNYTLRSFNAGKEIRIALHHNGSDTDADRFAAAVENIIREERAIFGEFPSFETPYTFISDFLPNATADAMEHRNSTILTARGSLGEPEQMLSMLGNAAHEFFHSWNVERIRPQSLEPFRLDGPNPSGELWFAEGFTSYYEPLVMQRSGLWTIGRFASRFGGMLDAVIRSPARKYRSAEDMSRFAQFVDQASWSDPTNLDNTFLSYYTWGAAIGLGLDLSLRVKSGHKVTLDDYMRRMWQNYGSVKSAVEGVVARPYTIQNLRDVLAEVSGDRSFANEFFDRYIQGRDVVDYRQLLSRAGLLLQKSAPGRAWIGPVALDFSEGAARISSPTLEDTPAYSAGLDRGDELISFGGAAISGPGTLEEAVQRRKPGDHVRVSIRRRGAPREVTVTIAEDPQLYLVPVEQTGRQLNAEERSFRTAWLSSKQ